MTRRRLHVLPIALGLLLAGPALAAAGASGPAAPAIGAYLRATRIPCTTRAGESRCPIASLGAVSKVFYGTRGGASEAVAFVEYQSDATGNAMELMAVAFRLSGGAWVPVGRAEGLVGSDPREARFDDEGLTYLGTVMRPGDARVAPSGRRRVRLAIGPSSLRFVGPGSAGPSMSGAIRR